MRPRRWAMVFAALPLVWTVMAGTFATLGGELSIVEPPHRVAAPPWLAAADTRDDHDHDRGRDHAPDARTAMPAPAVAAVPILLVVVTGEPTNVPTPHEHPDVVPASAPRPAPGTFPD